MTPLQHALECAAQGWAVFPVSSDKVPRCPRGCLAASSDPATIKAMHAEYGFVLVAIATGEKSNVAALDLDHQHGAAEWWQDNRHRLPATRAHRTRSGGIHLWFRHTPGLRNSTARIAPGIDVRGEGGSCIYWPATGLPVLHDAPLADWPEWLVPPAKPATAPSPMPVFTGETAARRYAEAAMRNAILEVATAGPGTRNDQLNQTTYSLLRLVSTGAVTSREIAGAMAHAGIAAGLPAIEVEKTIASAIAARGGVR